MKKFTLSVITAFVIIVLTGTAWYIISQQPAGSKKKLALTEEETAGSFDKAFMLEEMYKQWDEMLRDPALGYVPIERLYNGWIYTRNMQEAQRQGRITSGIPGVTWINRGPSNVGGRTRAIMVSPNDVTGNTVFAGSVGGGLWKSTNMKSGSPTWSVVDDFLPNMAISTLAYDPSSTTTFYAGTGEGFNNADAARGYGIAKSTNGGTTWTFLASTQNSTFYYVNKIVVNSSGHIYAATSSGILRSLDGGTSWTNVQAGNYGDIEVAADGSFYAGRTNGTATSGAFKSTTGDPGSWSQLTNGITAGISYRAEIATAPSNANTVYVMQYEDTPTVSRKIVIYRSTDAGASFIRVGRPVDADGGIASYDCTRQQGWYDLILKVDPNSSGVVYAGGVDIFKSTSGGDTWTQIAHWYGGFGFQYAHADQHGMTFEGTNSNVMYFTNDGGVFQTTNGSAATPTITARNTNYAVTQFYACAAHPDAGSNYFLAGAQDNGSQKFTVAGFGATTQATGGDGAYCNIDQLNPNNQFTQYVYSNFYRSTNAGGSFGSVNYGNSGRFINPSRFDDATKALYAANNSGTFLRWTNAPSTSTFNLITVAAISGQTVSAITVSPVTADRVYFGTGSGQIIAVDGASITSSPASSVRSLGTPRAAYMQWIWIDPINEDHIIVNYSSYGSNKVFETLNSSAVTPTWTNKTGTLPDLPVYSVLPDPANGNNVLAATEIGVYSCNDFNVASPTWVPTSTGLANCRVTQLQLRASDNMVVASTHGRGLFTSDIFVPATAAFTPAYRVSYIGATIQFSDNSTKATSWQWDFDGDGTFESTAQNPTYAYSNAGVYNATLRINGDAHFETIVPITILPNRGTPYNLADGGDFEANPGDFAPDQLGASSFSRGSSVQTGKNGVRSGSNAWVLDINSPNYTDNATAYLYTPSYNCTVAGNYTISFYAKYDVENTWDGFRIDYSTNKGVSWLPLGTTVVANWYDYSNPNTDRPFPQNEAFFSNTDKAAYTLCTYTTSVIGGNASVAFRVHFESDVNTNAPGVALDDFTLTGQNNPVPVKLISFTGYNNGNINTLQWRTTNEFNSDRYEVERSLDGQSFEKIGTVTSKNNLAGASYQYNDNISRVMVNTFYYRLKMVDRDGRFSYSPVVLLRLLNRKETITVLGNYSSGFVKVLVPADMIRKEPVRSVIVTQNGSVIQVNNLTATQNNVDVSRLAAGMYYIRFSQSTGIIKTEKFIKQ